MGNPSLCHSPADDFLHRHQRRSSIDVNRITGYLIHRCQRNAKPNLTLQSVSVSQSRGKASLDQSNGTRIPLCPTPSSAVGIGEVVQQTRNTHSSKKHCHVISRGYKEGNQEVYQDKGTWLGYDIKCRTHSCHVLLVQFKPDGRWKQIFSLMEEIASQSER